MRLVFLAHFNLVVTGGAYLALMRLSLRSAALRTDIPLGSQASIELWPLIWVVVAVCGAMTSFKLVKRLFPTARSA